MAYTASTAVPTNNDLCFFEWSTPSDPSPRLAAPINATQTTISFTSAPLDHNGDEITTACIIGIRNSTTGYTESIYVPAAGFSNGVATGVTRGIYLEGLDFTSGNADLAVAANQDSVAFCNISGVLQALNFAGLTAQIGANIKFNGRPLFMGTGVAACPVFADATARDAAIVSPQNGDMAYLTSPGAFTDYTGGSWITRASGGTFPNASTTVAGKVEIATDAELQAGTNTGGTGAIITPGGASFNETPTANKVPVAGSSGDIAIGWIPDTAIQTQYIQAAAGEAVDGSTTPQLVYISDGANSRTAGRFYKADANDTTNISQLGVGFITENASSVGTNYNVKTGTVGGFTGLTAGALYYTSDTAGGITATPTAGGQIYSQKAIGIATTTTTLYVFGLTLGPVSFTSGAAVTTGATTNVDIYTGYRAKAVQFDLYLDSPGGTTAPRALFNGVYNGSASLGTLVQTSTGGTTFGSITKISAQGLTVSGSGANSASITLTITINSDFVRFAFVNAIVSTGGTCNYEIGATIMPF